MKTVHLIAAVGVLCLPLAAVSTPVLAASAHNSQAGADGPSTNNDGPSGMTKRMRQMSGKPMKRTKKM